MNRPHPPHGGAFEVEETEQLADEEITSDALADAMAQAAVAEVTGGDDPFFGDRDDEARAKRAALAGDSGNAVRYDELATSEDDLAIE